MGSLTSERSGSVAEASSLRSSVDTASDTMEIYAETNRRFCDLSVQWPQKTLALDIRSLMDTPT